LKNCDIAVIGLTGKFPKSDTLDIYFKNLIEKRECITHFENQEDINDKDYVNARGILESVDYPNLGALRLKNQDIELMDPQLKILLGLAYAIKENYKSSGNDIPKNTGVYTGVSSSFEWKQAKLQEVDSKNAKDIENLSLFTEDCYYSAHISYQLGFLGPSMNINSSCASSLSALYMAYLSLAAKEIDCALVAGCSINYPFNKGYFTHETSIFSGDGNCRTFDEQANGCVPGDGAGIILIKRLDDAIADRDKIYAVIKGIAMTNDGRDKMGYIVPSMDGQCHTIKKALNNAGISSNEINFVEMHGLGTPIGDAIEFEALKSAFKLEQSNSCAIGSVKPNIGYLDTASGMAGLIKAILSLENKVYPPNINFKKNNSNLSIENSAFFVNTENLSFDNKITINCGVSSFGDGGNNVHVIMQNYHKF